VADRATMNSYLLLSTSDIEWGKPSPNIIHYLNARS
jgi:hypothetical protein